MVSDWHPTATSAEASVGAEGTARRDAEGAARQEAEGAARQGAEGIARQAASFLAATVHNEVDDAHVGSTRVLVSGDGASVYAGAVVSGPLRIYVATAWGPSGHAGHKRIVSYPDTSAAQTALDDILSRQQAQGYAPIGSVDGEA